MERRQDVPLVHTRHCGTRVVRLGSDPAALGACGTARGGQAGLGEGVGRANGLVGFSSCAGARSAASQAHHFWSIVALRSLGGASRERPMRGAGSLAYGSAKAGKCGHGASPWAGRGTVCVGGCKGRLPRAGSCAGQSGRGLGHGARAGRTASVEGQP